MKYNCNNNSKIFSSGKETGKSFAQQLCKQSLLAQLLEVCMLQGTLHKASILTESPHTALKKIDVIFSCPVPPFVGAKLCFSGLQAFPVTVSPGINKEMWPT